MKLVPVSTQHLRLGEPLPFGLRDAGGRLLMGAGIAVRAAEQFDELLAQPVFTEEAELAAWNRRVAVAMHAKLRQNAPLREVAAARPDARARATGGLATTRVEEIDTLVLQLDAVLREPSAAADGSADCGADGCTHWCERALEIHQRARAQVARRTDATLYLLVHRAGHETAKYSSHHALLSLAICELAAPLLGWSAGAADALGRAALLMNVAMTRLQDQLAAQERAPTAAMREHIAGHAEQGAQLLEQAGFGDRLAIEVVRWHHDASMEAAPLASLPPARQLARLLRRVDIFGAKLSRRALREPMSPVQAAREACLGADGQPDEIGQALLKAVGLYPPGSFVELASGEVGIVIARGRRANLPVVASLVSARGTPLADPVLRDTADPRHAVKRPLPPARERVRPPHERLMAWR